MKEEEDASCTDGSDQELSNAGPSIPYVSSSTNGNGLNHTSSSVITSQLGRLDQFSHALLALAGKDPAAVAAAAAAVAPQLAHFNSLSEATTSQLSTILSMDRTSTNSNKSSNGSDGSNSASPLSHHMPGVGAVPKRNSRPRAADSPGSGSTTSTTTTTTTAATTTGQPGREKQFKCNICDRSFGYKHVLQNHERTHTGEKPFECVECHKRFTRDHHLKTHMRLHTGEKPYHCEFCDRQFVQVANLRRHLRVHTGEKPYACTMCDSKFSDSNQLKAHGLIHKNEKPFTCDKCEHKFRRRHHMNHHKCPADEANIGRPRRGRRPRSYDGLTASDSVLLVSSPRDHPVSPVGNGGIPSTASLATAVTSSTAAAMATNSSLYPAALTAALLPHFTHLGLRESERDASFHHSHSHSHSHSHPHLTRSPIRSPITPPPAHAASGGGGGGGGSQSQSQSQSQSHSAPLVPLEPSTKSRRKPKHTVRLLASDHPDLARNILDKDGHQLMPLNMAVGKSSPLDLSRSKSDAESDVPDEDDLEDEMMDVDETGENGNGDKDDVDDGEDDQWTKETGESCDEYVDDEPTDLSRSRSSSTSTTTSKPTGNGNGNGFHSSYHHKDMRIRNEIPHIQIKHKYN